MDARGSSAAGVRKPPKNETAGNKRCAMENPAGEQPRSLAASACLDYGRRDASGSGLNRQTRKAVGFAEMPDGVLRKQRFGGTALGSVKTF